MITEDELALAIQKVGFSLMQGELAELMAALDSNKDGQISYDEFAVLAEQLSTADEGDTEPSLKELAQDFAHEFSAFRTINVACRNLLPEPTRMSISAVNWQRHQLTKTLAAEDLSTASKCRAACCISLQIAVSVAAGGAYLFLLAYQLYVGAKFARRQGSCAKPLHVWLIGNGSASFSLLALLAVAPVVRKRSEKIAGLLNLLAVVVILFCLVWLCWGSAAVYNPAAPKCPAELYRLVFGLVTAIWSIFVLLVCVLPIFVICCGADLLVAIGQGDGAAAGWRKKDMRAARN